MPKEGNHTREFKYLTLLKNYDDHLDKIVDFYNPKYKKRFDNITVLNSTIICLAFLDNKIIGAVRSLSDLSRHGIIVDLFVENEFQGNGIGTKLLENIIIELLSHGVATISLTTEPNRPSLLEFYKKNGFEPVPGSINLIYS